MALTGTLFGLTKTKSEIDSVEIFKSMMLEVNASGAVVMDGRNIAAGSIYANQLSANSITATKIKAGEITTDHITTSGISANKIKAGELRATNGASWLNLDTGRFSFASGKISWDGTTLNLSANTIKVGTADVATAEQVNQVSSDLNNIQIGVRNLVIRSEELTGQVIGVTGAFIPQANHAVMKDFIKVTPQETLYFTQKPSILAASDGGFWRFSWHGSDYAYISRAAFVEKSFKWTVPAGAYNLRVSYAIDVDPKIERGNKPTDFSLSPEDVQKNIDNVQLNLDNLEISGNNLVKDSETFGLMSNNTTAYPITTQVTAEGGIRFTRVKPHATIGNGILSLYETIKGSELTDKNWKGRNLVFSLRVRSDAIGRTIELDPYIQTNGVTLYANRTSFVVTGNWQTLICSFKNFPYNLADADNIRFMPRMSTDMRGYQLDIRGYQIEFGTNASTDWSLPRNNMVSQSSIMQSIKDSPETVRMTGSRMYFDNDVLFDSAFFTKLFAESAMITNLSSTTINAEQIIVGSGVVGKNNLVAGKSFTGSGTGSVASDGIKKAGSPFLSFGTGTQTVSSGAENGYAQVDLGGVYRVAQSKLYFYNADVRVYYYKIKYSIDGVKWSYAVGGSAASGWNVSVEPTSAGNPSVLPTVDNFAAPVSARYFRVYANGNSINNANHIMEWELFSTLETRITGDEIVTNSITTNQIAANAITANEIKADSISSTHISSTGISAAYIKAGRLTATNGASWIDLDNGQFSYGNGKITYNGSTLAVNVDSLQITNKDVQTKVHDMTGGGKVFKNPLTNNNNSPTNNGVLVIKTPITTPYMTKVSISGYNYVSANSNIDLEVSFYAYDNNAFHNTSYISKGNYPIDMVRLARDSSGRAVIIIGTGSNVWSYPKIQVTEAIVAQSTPPDSWQNGWSLAYETSISAYTGVVTINGNDYKSDIGSAQGDATNAKGKTDLWTFTGTTEINGGKIRADTVTATQIAAKTITATQIAANAITIGNINPQAFSQGYITTNPIFSDWPNSYPTGYTAWSASPGLTKETTLTKNGGFGARFAVTTASAQTGLTLSAAGTINNQVLPKYLVVELDFMLVSGGLGGSGVLIDWTGVTGTNRVTVALQNEVVTPTLNKWYTVRKVIKAPSLTGTFTTISGFLMANYSAQMGTMVVKNIIFDRFALREPSTEEINTFEGNVSNAITTINGEGVTVKDGSFFLEDNMTNTKYSVVASDNIVVDHSFEMIDTGTTALSGEVGLTQTMVKDSGSDWLLNGNPKLWFGEGGIYDAASTRQMEINYFGKKSLNVNSANYARISKQTGTGGNYTVSAYFRAPYGQTAAGIPQIHIWQEDSKGGTWEVANVSFPAVNINNKNEVKRYSTTFNATGIVNGGAQVGYIVEFRSANANWVNVDGVQIVKGSSPTNYEPETGVWYSKGSYASVRIPTYANLNDYTSVGFYHTPLSSDAATILNTATNVAFSLLVEKHAGIKQTFTDYRDGAPNTYIRNMYNGVWGPWKTMYLDTGWVGLSFVNGYARSTSEAGNLRARRIGDTVYLAGGFRGPVTRSDVQISSLPANLTPGYQVRFDAGGMHGTAYPEQHAAMVIITSDGRILLGASTANSINYLMDGYSFAVN